MSESIEKYAALDRQAGRPPDVWASDMSATFIVGYLVHHAYTFNSRLLHHWEEEVSHHAHRIANGLPKDAKVTFGAPRAQMRKHGVLEVAMSFDVKNAVYDRVVSTIQDYGVRKKVEWGDLEFARK